MTFPAYFHLFGLRIHPHPVMEFIAYSSGFQLFLFLRRKRFFPQSAVSVDRMLWLIVAAVFGAAAGAKCLAWIESAPAYLKQANPLLLMFEGKTIVGGLIGGWIGVEIAKSRLHINHSTGDAFVFPLILGMAIGRVGCFLTGLDDHTCGNPTSLPWGVNFGDGIPRHPAQLYDIFFLFSLGVILLLWHRARPRPNGQLFFLFLGSYLAYRFAIEFIKPRWTPILGLSPIQFASLIAATVCMYRLITFDSPTRNPTLANEPALPTHTQ